MDALVKLISGRFRQDGGSRTMCMACWPVRAQERWTVVEHAVAVCPDGMQRLLGNAGWDIDGAR